MKFYIVVGIGIIFISFTNSQTVQYANRFRNLTISSETGDIHLLNMTIYRKDVEHCIALKANITKDIRVKSLKVQIYRCVYEKSACENFQKWTFDKKIKEFVYTKNHFWSPAIQNLKPPLDFPLLRKGIYEGKDITLDANAVILFYPEATNYYFQVEITLFNFKEEKAVIIWIETSIHSFVKRDRNRNRGKLSMTKS